MLSGLGGLAREDPDYLGLVPVAGAVIGFVAGALFSGWMMARELVGSAMERRGHLRLVARAAVLLVRRLLGSPSDPTVRNEQFLPRRSGGARARLGWRR